MFFVYFLRCRDNSLYCGYTVDLEKRVKVHNEGKGAKYTRKKLPVYLVYSEEFLDKSSAMKREYELKQLTKREKEELVRSNKF